MEEETENLPVSKSQRKRDAQAIFDLARRLIEIKPSEFARVPIEEPLKQALIKARGIKKHVARKRETQYVAKLMRQEDLSQIEAMLEQKDESHLQQVERVHILESWRDALIESPQQALSSLCACDHQLDRQRYRALIKQSLDERSRDLPPRAFRQLFALLKETDQRVKLTMPDLN